MTVNGTANGHSSSRVLKAGVWAPIPTFFDDSEELGTYRTILSPVKHYGVGIPAA